MAFLLNSSKYAWHKSSNNNVYCNRSVAPIIRDVLLAASLIGYVASAATFYFLAVKSALKVEEHSAFIPTQVGLTVVEGGKVKTDDIRRAA